MKSILEDITDREAAIFRELAEEQRAARLLADQRVRFERVLVETGCSLEQAVRLADIIAAKRDAIRAV